MDEIAEFWKGRMARYGHTGWRDEQVYAFDQPARIRAFARWLRRTEVPPGRALDFGCGSGDFSRLLLRRGWSVVGYDKYVVPSVAGPRFIAARGFDEVRSQGPYDLVLAVTVLDHILDPTELEHTLGEIRDVLRKEGRFYFLEYSPDRPMSPTPHQLFRTMSAWTALLARSGLIIVESEPVFHPVHAPSVAWRLYEALDRLCGRRARGLLAWVALRLAPNEPTTESPIHVITGRTSDQAGESSTPSSQEGRNA